MDDTKTARLCELSFQLGVAHSEGLSLEEALALLVKSEAMRLLSEKPGFQIRMASGASSPTSEYGFTHAQYALACWLGMGQPWATITYEMDPDILWANASEHIASKMSGSSVDPKEVIAALFGSKIIN